MKNEKQTPAKTGAIAMYYEEILIDLNYRKDSLDSRILDKIEWVGRTVKDIEIKVKNNIHMTSLGEFQHSTAEIDMMIGERESVCGIIRMVTSVIKSKTQVECTECGNEDFENCDCE